MCSSCSGRTKKFWVFGCGTFVLLIAMVLGLLWPTLFREVLHNELRLTNVSTSYENWIETPLPVYMDFYMFNWTNSDQAYTAGVLPHFEEMGPYVFSMRENRVDLEWHHDNGTVSFNQTKTWHFMPEMSSGTLDDMITNLNPVCASAAYAARNMNTFEQIGVNLALNAYNGSLLVTKTVRELLFDGYKDDFLDFLIDFNPPGQVIPPFTKFGWFVDRNGTSEFDGRMNMFTGETDMSKLGNLYAWNEVNKTNFYRGECSVVRGSTGQLWHPHIAVERPIEVFSTDLCRALKLDYEGPTELLGLEGGKWVGSERLFDNGTLFPDAACYCTGPVCPDLMPGVMNVSDCRYGAPAFVSFPHFYLADKSYRETIEGMSPNQSLHEFYMSIEPTTGIPLEVQARFQINLLLQPVPSLTIYKNVPTLMVPMLWFTQRAKLTEDIADQANMVLLLSRLGLYVSYGFAGLGAVLLIVGVLLVLFKSSKDPESKFMYEGEDNHAQEK